MQPLPIYHHLYAANRSSVLLGDCLHILAGQIAGDYVLHLEFVPSSVHLSHRCGLFVIVEPAGAVALRGDQLYTFCQHTALTVAGSVFDYLDQPLGSPPIDRTTAEFPVALCEGVVFRIVGQLRPGHTIPGSVGGGYLLQMQSVERFVVHGITIYGLL